MVLVGGVLERLTESGDQVMATILAGGTDRNRSARVTCGRTSGPIGSFVAPSGTSGPIGSFVRRSPSRGRSGGRSGRTLPIPESSVSDLWVMADWIEAQGYRINTRFTTALPFMR